MEEGNTVKELREKIKTAIELLKCRKCGCMKESLETIKNELTKIEDNGLLDILKEIENSIERMEPTEYS